MFSFVLAVSRSDGAIATKRMRQMLVARGDAPDGVATASATHAAAGIMRWAVMNRDLRVAPHWDSVRNLLVAGDVRLYNRTDLLRGLGDVIQEPDPTDLELARLAYLKWGRGVGAHLAGDFAFAVWEEERRTLFAIRDHLGIRPVYYHLDTAGISIASDIRHLLCLVPNISNMVDDAKILDRFTRRQRRHGRTFFRGICQLRPGHYAVDDGRGFHQVRYWQPPAPQHGMSYSEHSENLRGLFACAVRDRVQAERPIVAHSSGGYDSSSILLAAERVYEDGALRPPLIMASALTLGTPCDESHLMDAVARRVRFESHRWSALDPEYADIEDPILIQPGMRRGMGGGPRGDLTLAISRGARVLLSGDFGDTIMCAWGLRRDLVSHRRWRPLVEEAIRRNPFGVAARLLVKASLGFAPPSLALRLSEQMFSRPKAAPAWMGPRLLELYPPPPEELEVSDRDWASHLDCELWTRVTSPHVSACLDYTVQFGANEGLEVRIPYADVRFVEGVLQIPSHQRISRGSIWGLRDDVLSGWMPPDFETRRSQAPWTPVFGHTARHQFSNVRRLLDDGQWLSAPYIDRRRARDWLQELTQKDADAPARSCMYVAEFGALEAWLRHLLRYDARREVVR
jgi:asparagine synthase (glutamine-hydrolysing)